MASRRSLAAAFGVVFVSLSAPAPTRARESANVLDKLTYVTFDRSVALPGVNLEAGSYIFELADPIGAWDLVRVSSRDRRVLYLSAFTRVVDRPHDMSPAQTFSFAEVRANAPLPIDTWWITGDATGRQFIYE